MSKYAEFPVEETDKFIYSAAPAQVQAPASVQVQAPGPVAPTAPATPVAKAPNVSGLVNKVAEANKQLQEQMPAPQPQSAASNLVGDITKNWESLLPLAAVPAIAWLASKAFGSEGESGGRPKEPPKSIADRTIRKVEPTFETKPAAPVETTKGLSPQDAELLRKYEAQQAAKTQPPMMGQPGFQPSASVAPPSVQALDQAFSASVAPPVVQTAPTLETTKETPKPDVEGSKAPPGMREQYTKNKKNPIGPGAFNHLANNLGLDKAIQVWEDAYGKTNVPYKQFEKDYSKAAGKEMMGPKQPLPPGAKPGGSFGTPKYIPEYIKGGGTLGPIAGLAGLAGLTALGSSPEARAAMGRAQNAIQDLGVSPDIFAGKGEEMGRLGKGYVTAGNPQYRAQITEQLKTEKDPQRRQLLLEEFQKAGGSGAGRGVAPPSSYQR